MKKLWDKSISAPAWRKCWGDVPSSRGFAITDFKW